MKGWQAALLVVLGGWGLIASAAAIWSGHTSYALILAATSLACLAVGLLHRRHHL